MSEIQKKPFHVKKIIINIVLIFILWFIFAHILCLRICHDQEAYPSVRDGDLLIALRTASPSPGDIIVRRSTDGGTAIRYRKKSDREGMLGVVVFLVRRRGF